MSIGRRHWACRSPANSAGVVGLARAISLRAKETKMAGPALDEELISLHYYARQQCSRQWVHFMAAMFAEFEERVDPGEADQFLEALGFKMARLLPLRRCTSLEELE